MSANKNMTKTHDLERFVEAQKRNYNDALDEIKNGKKVSHWMWYVFQQISGLGYSATSKFYEIHSSEEAKLYLNHEILGKRLLEISNALLNIEGKTAYQIFGSPDDSKLKSCMTLFRSIENSDPIFEEILNKYFSGKADFKSLKLLEKVNQL